MGTPYTPPGKDPTGNPHPQGPQPTPAAAPAPKGDDGPHETFKEKLEDALDSIGNAIGEAKFGQ